MITLADALKSYTADVLPKLKGAGQERYRIATLASTALAKLPLDRITPAEVKTYRDQYSA